MRQNSSKLERSLLGVSREDYGPTYSSHYLEQYKLYVEMADRISSRRQSANSFFLTLNTVIVGLVGYVQLGAGNVDHVPFYWLIGIAGILLNYMWYRLVRSYRDLNSGKFEVIYEIEKKLPLGPYNAEWEVLGRGENAKLYLPFTRIEMAVPWVFLLLHAAVTIRGLPFNKILQYFSAIT